MPEELVMLGYIDRFGAQAIIGRTLSGREVREMVLAENVWKAYQDRARAADWSIWTRDNPDKAELLNEAMRLWQNQT